MKWKRSLRLAIVLAGRYCCGSITSFCGPCQARHRRILRCRVRNCPSLSTEISTSRIGVLKRDAPPQRDSTRKVYVARRWLSPERTNS